MGQVNKVNEYYKWMYRIMANIDGENHLVWSYSKHFYRDEFDGLPWWQKWWLTKIKKYHSAEYFYGLQHASTAINWVKALNRDLQKFNAFDNLNNQIMKDGLFDPHFRLNKKLYPSIWVNPGDVTIYYEMHLVEANKYEDAKDYFVSLGFEKDE